MQERLTSGACAFAAALIVAGLAVGQAVSGERKAVPVPQCPASNAVRWDYTFRAWFCVPPSYIAKGRDGRCFQFTDGFAKPAKVVPCP